jgi:tetratricopeptide (TPR) repeat protein
MRNRLLMLACFCVVMVCGLPLAAPQDGPARQDQSQDQSKDDKESTASRTSDESSSKDTRIDLSDPKDDAKSHPMSASAVSDAQDEDSDVKELRPWDPHKALKDVEVGDFYFKKKNYRAAFERYKEALVYKPNDAIANFRLAECSEKLSNPGDAVAHYQEYLKILPHGPFAADAEKALVRLKANTKETSAK